MKPPTLPVQRGYAPCPNCWVRPGEVHQLSCPEVSPALFADFLAWQMNPPRRRRLAFPIDGRVFAGLLIGLPIGAAFYLLLSLLIWSL